MNLGFRVARDILKASDTHCATGDSCGSEKYCPRNNHLDSNGICRENQTSSGVSAGDPPSSGAHFGGGHQHDPNPCSGNSACTNYYFDSKKGYYYNTDDKQYYQQMYNVNNGKKEAFMRKVCFYGEPTPGYHREKTRYGERFGEKVLIIEYTDLQGNLPMAGNNPSRNRNR